MGWGVRWEGGLRGKEYICILSWFPFQVALVVKNLPANATDAGSIPGLGRSPEEGNGKQPQYSCLENSMYREAWQAAVHGVTKSRTRLCTAHTQLVHVVVHWKITQRCKAIIFWFFKKERALFWREYRLPYAPETEDSFIYAYQHGYHCFNTVLSYSQE